MQTTVFSFIMSLAWCSIFILFGTLLRHKKNYVLKFGVNFILLILVIGIFRILLPFEPKFSIVIHSDKILPGIQQFLKSECFVALGYTITWYWIILAVWVIGSAIFLLKIMLDIINQSHYVSRLQNNADERTKQIMAKIVSESRPRKNYRLIVSDNVPTPMLVGFFTPTVLLPPLSLSDEDMEYVLTHEWNHYLHKDLWKKLFFNVLCAFMWWNPLVYYLRKDLDYILEVNCDAHVVKNADTEIRVKYVESTVNVMKQLIEPNPNRHVGSIGLVGTTDSDKIVQRSQLVLDPPKKFDKLIGSILRIILLSLICVSYVFVVQPITYATPQDIPSSVVEITSTNSYLYDNEDGTYSVFYNGSLFDTVSQSDLESFPYSELEIKKENYYEKN